MEFSRAEESDSTIRRSFLNLHKTQGKLSEYFNSVVETPSLKQPNNLRLNRTSSITHAGEVLTDSLIFTPSPSISKNKSPFEFKSSRLSLQETLKIRNSESFVNKEAAPDDELQLIKDPSQVALIWCAFCGKDVVSKVSFRNGKKTFWSSVAIFFTGGALGCFLLPYMSNSCKDVKVYCSKCLRDLN